jgi:hypothetical protein
MPPSIYLLFLLLKSPIQIMRILYQKIFEMQENFLRIQYSQAGSQKANLHDLQKFSG